MNELDELERHSAEDRFDQPAEKTPILMSVANRPSRAVQWIWEGWMPKGYITLMSGRPGQGKGTTVAWLIRCAVKGEWPDGHRSEPCRVAVHSKEERWDDTMRPRLEAAGLSKEEIDNGIFLMRGDAMDCLEELKANGKEAGVGLLFFDAVDDGLLGVNEDGKARSPNNDGDVNPYMDALAEVASELNAAVIGCRHLKKFSREWETGDIASLIMGSTAWVGKPRMVLMLQTHHEKSEKNGMRVLVRVKSNLPCAWVNGGFQIGGQADKLVGEDPETGAPIKQSVADEWEYDSRSYHVLVSQALGTDKPAKERGDGRKQSRMEAIDQIKTILYEGPLPPSKLFAVIEKRYDTGERAARRAWNDMVESGHGEVVKADASDRVKYGKCTKTIWRLTGKAEDEVI